MLVLVELPSFIKDHLMILPNLDLLDSLMMCLMQ